MNLLIHYICEYFSIDQYYFKKTLKYSSFLSLVYFFALFLNLSPYLDDYNWLNWATSGSPLHGRPLVNNLLSIFSFNYNNLEAKPFLVNIQPGYQILASLIMVLSVTIFVLKLCKSKENNYLTVLVISFIANPFLLQTYSYSLASLTMACSYSIALIASLKHKGNLKNIIIGALLMLTSLCLYQISLNIFLGATTLLFLVKFQKNIKSSLKFLFENAIKAFIALASYKLFFINPLVNHTKSGYLMLHSRLHNFDDSFFSELLRHFMMLSNNVLEVYYELRILSLFTLISIIAFAIKYIFFSNNNRRIFNALIFGCTCFLIFFFSFGFQALLSNPIYSVRTLAGFSITLLASFYMYLNSMGKWFPSSRIIMILPIACFFLLSYKYANLRRMESGFNYHVTSLLVSDLNRLNLKKGASIYNFGNFQHSHLLQVHYKRNKILKALTVGNLQIWFINSYLHYHFDTTYYLDFNLAEKSGAKLCNKAEVLSHSIHYIVARKDEKIIVAHNNTECYKILEKIETN